MKNKYPGSFFISSSLTDNDQNVISSFDSWFEFKKNTANLKVNEIPFDKLDHWSFCSGKEKLFHSSGKFFCIEGIKVSTNFGKVSHWEQPIINQPDIGILGIITKVSNGIRYFLMQAKVEPGNINKVQISPTLQATKSNFTQVHKGNLPHYLDNFINKNKSKVLIDQLQSEHGARFLRKRNRNIVIEVTEPIDILDDFYWLSLGEIKNLLNNDNVVNMDARSVLSTIPLIDDEIVNLLNNKKTFSGNPLIVGDFWIEGFKKDLVLSCCPVPKPYKTINEIIAWHTEQKARYYLDTERIPLSKLQGWKMTPNTISNSDRFFSVIGVNVEAGTREIMNWSQPLIKDENIGLLGFIVKKINGTLHFLVQAKVEPGNIDIIELSPSVSCSNYEYVKKSNTPPPFLKYFFINYDDRTVHYDTLQSEEGGRFYKVQNRNMIVEIPEAENIELPENFIWMTLHQMMEFMKYSMFNIEARNLISSISFIK